MSDILKATEFLVTAEIDRLRAEVARLTAERDAAIDAHEATARRMMDAAEVREGMLSRLIEERDKHKAERDVLREALHSETTQREFLRRDLCDIAKGSGVNYPDVEAAKAEIIRRASQCARAEAERDRYRAAIEKHCDDWGTLHGSDHALWATLDEVTT